MREFTCYRTRDNKTFDTEEKARTHCYDKACMQLADILVRCSSITERAHGNNIAREIVAAALNHKDGKLTPVYNDLVEVLENLRDAQIESED